MFLSFLIRSANEGLVAQLFKEVSVTVVLTDELYLRTGVECEEFLTLEARAYEGEWVFKIL